MTAPPSPLSGEFAGRYTIERELGRGATAIVYLARDLDHGRAVAIKVLRKELVESITADRFLREIKLTAQLQHPHIVPVLASGDAGGRLYFALPYMDGGSLRDRLNAEKQLSIDEVLQIGQTIAGALAFAHARNLLHRDVKPENILFTGGQACLSDFGIARAMVRASEEATTSTGLVRGTPAYMSPEQAAGGQDIDARSDVYSLACVLYEALAGVPAFIGATPQAVVAQRISHEPRPIRVFRPSVTANLEAVLAKALAITPADRYQNAQEFQAALSGSETSGLADHRVARVRRPAGQRGAWLTASTIVVGGLLYLGVTRGGIVYRGGAAFDTTRVAVLPFEQADDPTSITADLIQAGLRRWTGLTLVEDFAIADALARNGPAGAAWDGLKLARQLHAGRYVRGRVTRVDGRHDLHLALYDTNRDSLIYQLSGSLVSNDTSLAVAAAALADSLVLRGGRGGTDTPTRRQRDVVSEQLFLQGRAALQNWNLARADSLLSHAAQIENASPRTFLWLAQVRAWRSPSTADGSSWRTFAERAVVDSGELSSAERQMAVGLHALAFRRYSTACAVYESMLQADSTSFVGWYGLAQCHDLDHVVVSDAKSPTGWRFRSSYEPAIRAFIHAFEALPSANTAFSDNAFLTLRSRLYTSPRFFRSGESVGPPVRRFTASAGLYGDTIAFIPIPIDAPLPAGVSIDTAAIRRGATALRSQFLRLARSLIVSVPRSLQAREAYAVALETVGDEAAADSLEAVARTTPDASARLRLLAAAAFVRVKTGVPNRLDQLDRARRMADSMLASASANASAPNPLDADALSRLAAIAGRCEPAARFAALASSAASAPMELPTFVVAEVQSLAAYAVLGCAIPAAQPNVREIERHLAAQVRNPADLRIAEMLLLPSINARFPPDTFVLSRIVRPRAFLALAQQAWAAGDLPRAREYLDSLARRRSAAALGDITPDAALPQAELYLALHDSARARAALDASLEGVRFSAPLTAAAGTLNVAIIGSLVRAMRLRADLGGSRADVAASWGRAADVLWSAADPDLRSTTRRRLP